MMTGRGQILPAGLAFLIVLFSCSTLSYGHALQPGFLQIVLVEEDVYQVVWKVPVVKGRPMEISARLPAKCDPRIPTPLAWDGAAYITSWKTKCRGGLEGGEIAIRGLELTATDVLVRFDFADGTSEARRLTANDTSFRIPNEPSLLEVVRTYTVLGVEHILYGADHLLFVLALLLLVKGARRIILTITTFTLAHSLSLAAATLGLIHVPVPPVEAVIALSIVFVAWEILRSRQGISGLTEQRPWIVAFCFGLLHGLGFAGALAEIGLPRDSIPAALLFFNIGVEIGQLLFIAAVLGLFILARRVIWPKNVQWPAWAWVVPPYAIGCMASYWVYERLAAF